MVFAPPQHGKSELVSRRLPAYILGRYPDVSVIACSYSADLSQRMSRDTQRIIDDSRYHTLFPETQINARNFKTGAGADAVRKADIFEVVGHKGLYRSAGVGGGITGMGADFGIIDDPLKDDEQAYSPTVREKVLDWYRGTFYTRLRKNARVLLTMTRWHRGDLAGALLDAAKQERGDRWTVLQFEGLRTTADNENDKRAVDEPLWEEFKSQADLHQIKMTLGPTRWAAMYQQDPRQEGGAEWPESFFGPEIWFTEWPNDPLVKVVALDPSKGVGSKHGDYSAFAMVALGRDGVFYVDANMANDRHCSILVDTSIEIQRTFGPQYFGFEVNQFQELLANDVQRRAAETAIPVPICTIDNRINKEVRIRRLTPYLSRGQLRFKGGSKGAELLVNQMRDFPLAEHDDGPDALEMAMRILVEKSVGAGDDRGDNLFGDVGARY
jgi:predicted phage terminase large subunit-like protein